MSDFTIKRTFHPIGQGAFYSEEFQFDSSKSKFIVYDCGSSNSKEPTTLLKQVVVNAFPDDKYNKDGKAEIDVLFLSHFHNDHINGLSLLKPKIVVCPFYNDDEILMFKVLNEYFKQWNTDLMENPNNYFGSDTIVIRVNPIDENAENIYRGGEVQNLGHITEYTTVDSGTPLGLSEKNAGINWCYIPYNFHYGKWLSKFKELLGSDYEILSKYPDNYIRDHKEKLREICKTFENDLNDMSLIVYSGPIIQSKSELRSTSMFIDPIGERYLNNQWLIAYLFRNRDDYFPDYVRRRIWGAGRIRAEKPAVLFYGDITLKESLIKIICRNLSNKVNFLGAIQLPHHGSYRSFDTKIFEYYENQTWIEYPPLSELYIISARKNNPRHPGRQTIAELIASSQMYKLVTEDKDTAVTEIWRIEG